MQVTERERQTMCANFGLSMDVEIARLLGRSKSTVGRYRRVHEKRECVCGGGEGGAELVSISWNPSLIRDRAAELMNKGDWTQAVRALRCAEQVYKLDEMDRSADGFSHEDVERIVTNVLDVYEQRFSDVIGQSIDGNMLLSGFDEGRAAVNTSLTRESLDNSDGD